MFKTVNKCYNLESDSKDEAIQESRIWTTGCFNLLISRTISKYSKVKNQQRRSALEQRLNFELPPINDKQLKQLYEYTSKLFLKICFKKYDNTGYQSTPYEKRFLINLGSIIEANKDLKYLEIYPNPHPEKNSKNIKPLIGCHIPDCLVFGLKDRLFSSVVIEIDGESHNKKYYKDNAYYSHLEELGILAISIPNDKVNDLKHIEGVIRKHYRTRSGPLDKQIQLNKRLIWAKTITCHMTLKQIDQYCVDHFNFNPQLVNEALMLIKQKDCPRVIKKEIMKELKLK